MTEREESVTGALSFGNVATSATAFLAQPKRWPRKCPGCHGWFVREQDIGCAVMHGPGQCCHYGCREVPQPAGGIGDPEDMTGFATRRIDADAQAFRLMAEVEPEGTERAGLIARKLANLEAQRDILRRHQPDASGRCPICAVPWACPEIVGLAEWAEYPG